MSKNPRAYIEGAARFQLLAHPSRLYILDELRRGPACVCHLQAVLGRPQAYISQQLRLLREADVVVDEKDGLNVYYRIADAHVVRLLEEMLGPAQPARRVEGCPCPHCTGQEVCCS
ncbi:MAG TPA: metalloregulator ArsR/SmtB family transcription factor [Anaerolineae bacterium]|nr:metalloregulator ArsR/SmtB family transcription factor [Anaerolineae bacterium]HQH37839.1 metalloregulator ArsR/SmtB family transcription factor [Anaerolineae bacterium]